MKIAVLVNPNNKEAVFYSKKVVDYLIKLKIEVLNKDLISSSDVVLTIGGDGTLIHAVKFCISSEKPILGINLGRVGFVATLEKNEISNLKALIEKKFILNSRSLIYFKCSKGVHLALNDIVISKEKTSKLSDFYIKYKGEKFNHRADGLIFSTPTGSTAYSFSVGGPIIDPSIECILMSQICPFSLFSRPIIFSKNSKILVSSNENFIAIIDGNKIIKLTSEDSIEIGASNKCLKIISFEKQNFYKNFKNKFVNLGEN